MKFSARSSFLFFEISLYNRLDLATVLRSLVIPIKKCLHKLCTNFNFSQFLFFSIKCKDKILDK